MDFKEKYHNALERAKKGLPIDEVFPELAESEDERIRKEIHAYLFNTLHNTQQLTPRTNELERWIAYLERQKEQKPAEWREEDEYKVDDICKLIEHATIIPRSGDDDTGIPPTRLNEKYKGELKAFIKSLKDRGNFPKSNTNSPSWKPSEEQMKALNKVIHEVPMSLQLKDKLILLEDELKKLM